MNVWKITAPAKLENDDDAPMPSGGEGTIRVRITKVFLSGVDAALYNGTLKARLPLIPGRFAVGFVADETSNPLFPKGTRVLLHTFCARPYTGTEKADFSEDDYLVCGQTQDGFLRDFVFVAPEDMTPIPNALNDERALIAHYVSLGRSAIERLDAKRGQHIAVVGANIMGILICQLLIDQQISPILIDTNPANLDFARTCGVYYTLPANDKLLSGVANITGGRLASGAIYVIGAPGNDHKIPFRVCARKSNTVFCGFVPDNATFSLDLALRKQLTLHFVQKCFELETAINLIITQAVNTDACSARFIRPQETANFFDSYHKHPEHDVSEINIVSLI